MAAGPGDQGAAGAAGRGYLRASHADRERVIDVLKVAFVQGRLTKGELDTRVGQTFAARTYGELAALTADLPPGLSTAPPAPARPARARPPVSKVIAVAMLVVPAPAVVAAAFISDSEAAGKAAMMTLIVYFMVWIVAGAQLIANWHDKRSRKDRKQLPPRPAQGGRALGGGPGSRPGGDLILCQTGSGDTRARHLPGFSVTPRTWRSPPARRAGAPLCT